MPTVATTAPSTPAKDVADEGRGREERPRRDLPDGDGVEQLRVGEPAQPVDQVATQVGEQDVPGSVQQGAGLQEDREQVGEVDLPHRRQPNEPNAGRNERPGMREIPSGWPP